MTDTVKSATVIPEVVEIRLKTKAEKEREKKERQKLEKQKQKKDKAPDFKDNHVETVVSPKSVQSNDLSPAASEDEAGKAAVNQSKKKNKGIANDEKPKKESKAVAALRARMEAQKKAAEEEARLVAEENARILAEQQRLEEEERLKEERKKEKKEREKQKIALLKKEGKYQTAAQKQAAAIAKQKLEAMLQSGNIKVAALDENKDKPKKPIYGKKKKPNANKQPENEISTREQKKEEIFNKSENGPEEGDSTVSSTDKQILQEGNSLDKHLSDVPDEWDVSSASETEGN